MFCLLLHFQPLVVKPDQLIKRRGKLGLIAVNKTFAQVKEWVNERIGKDQTIGNAVGKLRNFIIEPFVPHQEVRACAAEGENAKHRDTCKITHGSYFQTEEAYVCIYSHRNADTILFHHQGGVDIGDVDAKALKLDVKVDDTLTEADIEKTLLTHITADKKK